MNENHLILAVLAFESELIDLAQLTEVCQAWTHDKSVPLMELLQQRGWVTNADLVALERQLQAKLAKSPASADATLNATGGPDFRTVSNATQDTGPSVPSAAGSDQSWNTWPRNAPELLGTIGELPANLSQPSVRYTWVSEVGKGGLGHVWLARDNDLVREVALKEVRADAASSEAVRRLIKEAQITGQLQHPNIVPVYEVHRGERPFYTMKLVRGKTLAATIQEHHERKRTGHEDPISMPRLMSIFVSICNALGYAHSRGIIHRDLKPQNIVLGDFGEAIVLDWGLARSLEGDSDSVNENAEEPFAPLTFTDDALTDATQTGAALGTPAYMAPEQATGRVDLMDARTDIYGLGAILFEIVTGQPPHRLPTTAPGRNPQHQPAAEDPSTFKTLPVNGLFQLLIQITNGPTPHVRDLDPNLAVELDMVCAQAMAKERENRFQTAKDLKEALIEFQIHEKSIELTTAAHADLTLAKTSHKYIDFNRALYGFEEASRQWPENLRAAKGERETQITFARTAYNRGDYDLAVSLLDDTVSEQKAFRTVVQKAARERETHHIRIRYLRRFSLVISVLIAVIATTAAILVNNERVRAIDAEDEAKAAENNETQQRHVAERERRIANQQTQAAKRERQIANEQTAVAVQERQKAADQLQRADLKAQEARWGLYIASLRLAAAQLENRSIAFCNQTLQTSRPPVGEPDLRGWEWNYLWNQTHSDLLTIAGHTAAVNRVAFSPDSKQFVSGSADQTVRLWDALTGAEIRKFEGHSAGVIDVCFSHDGSRILSASDDHSLKVWDVQSGQVTLTLNGHLGTVRSAVFSPDDSRIVSGSDDKSLKVWDAQTGTEQLSLVGHQAAVLCVNFSSNGQQIISGSDDHTAKTWDAQTGKESQTFTYHSSPVLSVCFSPNGQQAVSGGGNGLIKLWNPETGKLQQTFEGHIKSIRTLVFASHGRRLVSASDDKSIKVWDLTTGTEKFTLRGHLDVITSAHVSADDKRIVSSSVDKTIKVWDALASPEMLSLSGHRNSVECVAFSPDTRRVVSGGVDRTVKVWDIYAGEPTMTLTGHTGTVQSVAYSPNGLLIASAGGPDQQPGELKLWHAETGEEILSYQGHTDTVNCVHFSPDGTQLLSGSADRTLKLWDTFSGQLLRTLSGHTDAVTSVSYGPLGRHFVSGSRDKTLRVWDAKTGQEKNILRGHSEVVLTVSFSPDAQRVVSGAGGGGKPGELKVWDILTGQETFSLQGHLDAIESVSFSMNGKRILSSSQEGRIKLWDADTGQELLALHAHAGGITSSTFCKDDYHILSGNQDGTLKIWDGRPESELLDRAIEREARTAVALLRAKTHDRQQLIDALQADPTLTPAARQKALGWINALQLR
jgi:WD40 repeat protein/serine/threonine protein kinase